MYLRAKGRTSPPAKTIGHRESINPTLAAIYSNMLQKKKEQLLKTPKEKCLIVNCRNIYNTY